MFTGYKLLSGKMKFSELLRPINLHHAIVGGLSVMFVVACLGATFSQLGILTEPWVLIVSGIAGGFIGKSVVI